MKKINFRLLLILVLSTIVINSCGGGYDDPPLPPPAPAPTPTPTGACVGVTVTVSGTTTAASSLSAADGRIAATATGGSGFTFSINNGAFGSSGTFSGLTYGSYLISAKNSDTCIGSRTFTVDYR